MFRVYKLKRNEKGQSLVEFAMVLPVLLIIVMAIIEFGWVFNGWITITSAAREGARVYAVTKDQDEARYAVRQAAFSFTLADEDIVIGLEEDEAGNEEKFAYVEVNAELTPIIGIYFTDDSISLSGNAVMRNE